MAQQRLGNISEGVPYDVDDNDLNVVAIWIKRDPKRWVAGVMAGLLAGLVAAGVSGLVSAAGGFEPTFAIKLMATPLLGPGATDVGSGMGAILCGLAFFELFCAFFGFVFAHFTGTNSLGALLPMGLVWAAFSWVFLWNLYFQSWKSIFAAQIPSYAAIPVCLAYGLSLSSVAFFDRILRGSNA